jgi:hypothetical protein
MYGTNLERRIFDKNFVMKLIAVISHNKKCINTEHK